MKNAERFASLWRLCAVVALTACQEEVTVPFPPDVGTEKAAVRQSSDAVSYEELIKVANKSGGHTSRAEDFTIEAISDSTGQTAMYVVNME